MRVDLKAKQQQHMTKCIQLFSSFTVKMFIIPIEGKFPSTLLSIIYLVHVDF